MTCDCYLFVKQSCLQLCLYILYPWLKTDSTVHSCFVFHQFNSHQTVRMARSYPRRSLSNKSILKSFIHVSDWISVVCDVQMEGKEKAHNLIKGTSEAVNEIIVSFGCNHYYVYFYFIYFYNMVSPLRSKSLLFLDDHLVILLASFLLQKTWQTCPIVRPDV